MSVHYVYLAEERARAARVAALAAVTAMVAVAIFVGALGAMADGIVAQNGGGK